MEDSFFSWPQVLKDVSYIRMENVSSVWVCEKEEIENTHHPFSTYLHTPFFCLEDRISDRPRQANPKQFPVVGLNYLHISFDSVNILVLCIAWQERLLSSSDSYHICLCTACTSGEDCGGDSISRGIAATKNVNI